MNKLSIIIILIVFVAFIAILWAADMVSTSFGDIGENLALGVIAIMLLIGLIRTKGDK